MSLGDVSPGGALRTQEIDRAHHIRHRRRGQSRRDFRILSKDTRPLGDGDCKSWIAAVLRISSVEKLSESVKIEKLFPASVTSNKE